METKRANEIRRTLADCGVSVRKFAAMVGVSDPYMYDILNGNRKGEPLRIRIEETLAQVKARKAREAAPAEPRVRQL